jgi:hypothetical protein
MASHEVRTIVSPLGKILEMITMYRHCFGQSVELCTTRTRQRFGIDLLIGT